MRKFFSFGGVLAGRLALSLVAAALVGVCSPSAHAATFVWDGGPGGTGTDLGVAANWNPDGIPTGSTSDVLQFDGTLAGALSLSYATDQTNFAAGNGIAIDLTAGQTSSVTIDGTDLANDIRLGAAAVTIANGGGAFSLGNGTGPTFAVTLGGAGTLTQTFTNNSTNAATIGSEVVWGFGNSVAHTTLYTGTGNWNVNNSTNSANLVITKQGAGTLNFTGVNGTTGTITMSAGVFNVASGANIGTGSLQVAGGTMNFSGATGTNGTNGNFRVGTVAGTTAVLNILPGANMTNRFNLFVGDAGAGTGGGAIYQSGGALTLTQAAGVDNLRIGSNGSGYGYYNLSGGTVTSNQPAIGASLADTVGVVDVSGGTFTSNGQTHIAAGSATSSGLLNATGGSVSAGTDIRMLVGGNASSIAVLNVGGGAGTATVTTGNSATVGVNLAQTNATAGSLSVVNLLPNGTLNTSRVLGTQANATTHFNFNGGTLKANAINAGTIFGDATLDAVNVYSGGGTINNNGTSITINRGLLAPTGSGVSGTTVSVPSGGAGYVGAPLVKLTGGAGTGATGYATVSGGVVTGIVITSPGIGYASGNTLTATFFGGGATTAATTVTGIPVAANASGGMTFTGSGTTNLSAASTYTGATSLTGGSLVLTGTGAINASSGITVNGAGAIFANNGTVASTPAIALNLGTVQGSGTVGAVTVASNAANTIADSLGATTKLTASSLTFNGAGAFSLALDGGANTTEAVTVTGALTTSGAAGAIKVNVAQLSPLTAGTTYDLVGFNSLVTGTLADFSPGIGVSLRNHSLQLNGTNTKLQLVVASVIDTPKWTGALSSEWSTNNLAAPKNWVTVVGGGQTDFIPGDDVLFDDSAATFNVDISVADVTPATTAFTNATNPYTIDGSKGIAGTTSLTKTGAATTTLLTVNTYSGATTIGAGATLRLGNGTVGNDGTIAGTSGVTNNGTLMFTRNGTVTDAYAISGAGGVTVNGSGTQILSGTNSYSGTTLVTGGGKLSIGANANLGSATIGQAPVTLDNGTLTTTNTALLTDTHAITIGAGGGTINISGIGSGGSSQFFLATANLLLGSGALKVTGNGTLTTSGAGNLRIGAANTFNGAITLESGGSFEYGVASAVDNAATVTINNEGELITQGSPAVSNPLNVTIAGGTNSTLSFENGNAGVMSGTVALNANGTVALRDWYNNATVRSGTISGQISGVGALAVNSGTGNGGLLTLSSASGNTYQGGTNISASRVLASTSTALGTGAVVVGGTNGQVQLAGGVNVANALTINAGAGSTSQGVIWVPTASTTATYSGDVNITGATGAGGHFGANGTGGVLNLTGKITSSVPVASRIGTVVVSNTSSSYTQLNVNEGTVKLGATNAIPTAAAVDLGLSAAANLDLAGFDQSLTGVTKNANGATVTNSAAATTSTLKVTGTSTFGGVIQNGAGTTALTVAGGASDSFTLSGANTYTGITTVSGGTLVINGSTAASLATNVGAGATLKGIGTVGPTAVATSGTLAPGNSVGTINLGSLSLAGNLEIETDGIAGTIDLAKSVGAVDISLGTLSFVQTNGPLSATSYVFVNYPIGLLTGTFATVNNKPVGYDIDYAYAGGTAIALVAVPEASALLCLGVVGLASVGVTSIRRRRAARKPQAC